MFRKDNDEGYIPKYFKEAWWHPDPKEREKWREATRKDPRDAIKRGVQRKIDKEMVSKDNICIKCK